MIRSQTMLVRDREGLSVVYIYPTHWAYVDTPENGP